MGTHFVPARRVASAPRAQGEETAELSDPELISLVLEGNSSAFEPLMRRYNQLLFRVARGIVSDDAEAEDVVQQAYLSAFNHLQTFAGRCRVSSWLVRITINEALGRLRKGSGSRRAYQDGGTPAWQSGGLPSPSPEDGAASVQLRYILENAIDALPDFQRLVFVLREVQGLSTAEAAEALETSEGNVRVTLHRVRQDLQSMLAPRMHELVPEAFAFAGERCNRIVARVIAALA